MKPMPAMRSSIVFRSVVHKQLKIILKHSPKIISKNNRKMVIQERASKSIMNGSSISAVEDFEDMFSAPDNDSRIMSGMLDKLQCCEIDFEFPWEPRQVYLSTSTFRFTFPETDQLADCSPLHEISQISVLKNEKSSKSFRPQGHEEWSRQSIWEHQDSSDRWFVFAIYTVDGGINAGRTYFLRADSESSRKSWIKAIRKAAKAAVVGRDVEEMGKVTWLSRTIISLRRVHRDPLVQNTLAMLIAANFLLSCLQAQMVPLSSSNSLLFSTLDIIFTIAFFIELCINIFVNWFR